MSAWRFTVTSMRRIEHRLRRMIFYEACDAAVNLLRMVNMLSRNNWKTYL